MFTWIPLYQEITRKVLEFENRQGELLALLRDFTDRGLQIGSLGDENAQGIRFPLAEIDPFSFFATFNWQGRKPEKRRAILAALREAWQLSAPVPEDFDGVPLANPQQLWFFTWQHRRDAGDIGRLWQFARRIVEGTHTTVDRALFTRLLEQRSVGEVKLSIGMFWLNPREFLPADKWMRGYMERRGVSENVWNGTEYFHWLDACIEKRGTDFPAISLAAYAERKAPAGGQPDAIADEDLQSEMIEADADAGARHVRYMGPLLDSLRSFNGAAIAKVATAKVAELLSIPSDEQTERTPGGDLRFPKNVAFARLRIRDEGMIEPVTPQTRGTWKLTSLGQKTHLTLAQAREIFQRQVQAYAAGLEYRPMDLEAREVSYTKSDAIEGLFMDLTELDTILARLTRKKGIILQGPPGVGKTFVARRLAHALMGERDDSRVCMVQFHPSYGYEDFIQGYRPDGTGLRLRNGVFHEFARRARHDGRPCFFIIDEINRGNLAKIFGELLMLLEADKRGPAFAVPLTYAENMEETFWLPENLYIIGTMNTADRSLAMVDYALRRRFAFISLDPALHRAEFREWLIAKGAPSAFAARIAERVGKLNDEISAERDLGRGFRIGHSYFCPATAPPDWEAWYQDIIESEIAPLLEEYFDKDSRVKDLTNALLAE